MSSKKKEIVLWGSEFLSKQNKPALRQYVLDRHDVFGDFSRHFDLKKAVLCTKIIERQSRFQAQDGNRSSWVMPTKFENEFASDDSEVDDDDGNGDESDEDDDEVAMTVMKDMGDM